MVIDCPKYIYKRYTREDIVNRTRTTFSYSFELGTLLTDSYLSIDVTQKGSSLQTQFLPTINKVASKHTVIERWDH